jgi:hypothetical protein
VSVTEGKMWVCYNALGNDGRNTERNQRLRIQGRPWWMKMCAVSVSLKERTGALCCLTPHEKLDTSLGTSHRIFNDRLGYRKVCVSWMSRKFIHYNKTLNWDCLSCLYHVAIFHDSTSCSAFYKG